MSTAIVPRRQERDGGVVSYLSGGVAVDIRLDAAQRGGALRYSMRLAAAQTAVAARLYGVERNGVTIDLGALEVAPLSTGRSIVPFPRSDRRRYESVYLELVGDDLHLIVEAPRAVERRSRRPLYTIAALTATALGAVCGAALTFALPQAPAFAVPSTATAGLTVRLPYTTHGLASWAYAASADDGSTLAAGSLTQNRGEIALALPPRLANKTVTIHMLGTGVFGHFDRVASFPVTPMPAARRIDSIARIGALTARRERLGDVESVLVSYLAVGNAGELAIFDQHGKVVAHGPFTHAGTQRLTVPPNAASAGLSARLQVRLGSSVASASVGLPAAPAPRSTLAPSTSQPAAAASPLIAPEPPSSADAEAVTPAVDTSTATNDPFAVVGTPKAGQSIRLAIRHNFPGMQLRLEDDAGTVIDEVAVPSRATAVSLHAPASTTVRTYYISSTYGSENGQEVVVRSIRVSAP